MIIWNKKDKKFEVTNGSTLDIGKVEIGENVTIQVKEKLTLGDGTYINDNCIVKGVDITIGKNFWMDAYAEVGGGSCFTPFSKLEIGDNCHLGKFAFINTARLVKIGFQVGMGMDTRIYTHGAYLSALNGFPYSFGQVIIGDCVWIPSAIILPNIRIGSCTVIGVGSVVTKDVKSNCLSIGRPAKVVKSNIYPQPLSAEKRRTLLKTIIDETKAIMKFDGKEIPEIKLGNTGIKVFFGDNKFTFSPRYLHDEPLDEAGEYFKNQLRRYGVRFP